MDIGYFNTENFRKRQHLSIQKLGIIGIGYEDTRGKRLRSLTNLIGLSVREQTNLKLKSVAHYAMKK